MDSEITEKYHIPFSDVIPKFSTHVPRLRPFPDLFKNSFQGGVKALVSSVTAYRQVLNP
jgi:hypothetical protein